ncbi:MAG: arginine--tRNA ligase, partial [bacterium]|nr:arginine--tRNA ligase [bacterium]
MDIKDHLIQVLEKTVLKLKEIGKLPVDFSPNIAIEQPRDTAHGDFATNLAFQLAKPMKLPPREVAKLLCDSLAKDEMVQVEKVEIAGAGFVNFYIKTERFTEVINRIIQLGANYGKSELGAGKKVNIEFVSANPTGPLNVVNARAASIGLALSNLLNAVGYQAHKESYINDAGNQVSLFGASLQALYLESCGIPVEFPKEGYPG